MMEVMRREFEGILLNIKERHRVVGELDNEISGFRLNTSGSGRHLATKESEMRSLKAV